MIASPVPNGPPPPAAITTYCLPPASYVIGVARAPAGSAALHSSLPVSMSNAWGWRASVAAMNTRPPAVAIGPPRLGDPGTPPIAPSGPVQATPPLGRFTATSAPQGGGVQGNPAGPRMTRLRMT